MAFTYDLATDVGKVRLLVPDRDAAYPAFQDGDLTALLSLEGDVRRAAALALETIAADTVMTLRVTTTLGLTVDGAKASDAILKRAATLRTQADAIDAAAVAADVDGLFDIAEWVVDPFSRREHAYNDALRSGG